MERQGSKASGVKRTEEEGHAWHPGSTSLQVLPHLPTCISSFNLPSLSTLCSEGMGA